MPCPHTAPGPVVLGSAGRTMGQSPGSAVVSGRQNPLIADNQCADRPPGTGRPRRHEVRNLHEISVPTRTAVHAPLIMAGGGRRVFMGPVPFVMRSRTKKEPRRERRRSSSGQRWCSLLGSLRLARSLESSKDFGCLRLLHIYIRFSGPFCDNFFCFFSGKRFVQVQMGVLSLIEETFFWRAFPFFS